MEATMAQMISKLEVSEAQIAERAYERWLSRGCPISDGVGDWLAARADLETQMTKPKRTTGKPKATRKPATRKQDAVASL
jgi:hypothetical protein